MRDKKEYNLFLKEALIEAHDLQSRVFGITKIDGCSVIHQPSFFCATPPSLTIEFESPSQLHTHTLDMRAQYIISDAAIPDNIAMNGQVEIVDLQLQ